MNEPECFEPLSQFTPGMAYYPKVALQNQQPGTVTRTTSIRTAEYRLTYRPADQSELYDLRSDPRELKNVYGEPQYRTAQSELFERMMDYYVNTSGIAPRKQDARDLPKQTG